MKLTDKQINIIIGAVGVVVLIVFAVFVYFDYEEIDKTRQEHSVVQGEIAEAKKKQAEIKGLQNDLWFLQKKHEHFKKALPDERDFVGFYANLEEFRLQKKIKPWKIFQTGKVIDEGKKVKQGKGAMVLAIPPPPQPKQQGPYIKTEYTASLPATFNQLGQLLNQIENYKLFYSVEQIQIDNMILPKKEEGGGTELEGNVTLYLTSFSYAGATPMEQEAVKMLQNFKPEKKKEEEFEAFQKECNEKVSYSWAKPNRDPFDENQVLIKITAVENKGEIKEPEIRGPDTNTQLKDIMKNLQVVRDQLRTLALTEAWMELESLMKDKKYEMQLGQIITTPQNDPDGSVKGALENMKKELGEWKNLIKEANREKKARQLIEIVESKIVAMEESYKKGKEKGSLEILQEAIKIYNELMPQFRDYKDFEAKIKPLGVLRRRVEEINSRVETQIKIINLAAKLKLFGIIYIKSKPELSVAFIDKKAVHKNDILLMGFVVHEIEEGKVILRYKEETVPIPLKKISMKEREAEN